jgi:hypothetical protein
MIRKTIQVDYQVVNKRNSLDVLLQDFYTLLMVDTLESR